MAAPTTTTWDLEPHTRAKHEILKRYLRAWMPILSQGGFPEVMYVDGFAGPGRYSRGEDGSPLIALRAALDRREQISATIRFVFIEKDRERARMLEEVVGDVDEPANFRVDVVGGESFEAAFGKILDWYETRGPRQPPIFAFIDPFGWSGIPFSIVRRVMGYRSCEVLVTFMYEEINRFLGHPDQEGNFDAFFGTTDWRQGARLAGPRKRNRFLHDLYLRQLREDAGAGYVRSFEMRNEKDLTDYYLFHATNNILGLKRMKEAMWMVDDTGEFSFSDATDPDQLVLLEKRPRFELLSRQVCDRFGGRIASVKEVEEFVVAETAFRETHYKRQVLRPLELLDPPMIEPVDPPPERRRGTYGQRHLKLRFRSTPRSGNPRD